jgi:predicted ABC-type ATPase
MKKILIIAGCNGAGKTTFAEEFLPHEAACPEFINADLIAAGLSPFQPDQVAFAAGRIMLPRIQALAAAEKSFAFETTLSSRSYLRMIPIWQNYDYRVELHFLKLPNAEYAVKRVKHRVRLGGHHIPVDVIRRRFTRGWRNFENDYKMIVDEWVLYDSSNMEPTYLDSGSKPSSGQVEEAQAKYGEIPAKDSSSQKRAGIEAALRRAGEKAAARARAAGLEPIVATPPKASNSYVKQK